MQTTERKGGRQNASAKESVVKPESKGVSQLHVTVRRQACVKHEYKTEQATSDTLQDVGSDMRHSKPLHISDNGWLPLHFPPLCLNGT